MVSLVLLAELEPTSQAVQAVSVEAEAEAESPTLASTPVVETEEVGQYFCTGNYVCNSNCP